MSAAAERAVLLAAAVAVVLIVVLGLGVPFLGTVTVTLYTTALALPVLAQGLATGLRWGSSDRIAEVLT